MRIQGTSKHGSRSGMALVTSMIVLGVLMAITYASLSLALSSQKRMSGSFDDRRAFLLADAGLNEAFEAMRNGGTGAIGNRLNPAYLGGGVFWVEATLGPATVGIVPHQTILASGETLLESTAMVGSGRSALAAVVAYDDSEDPLFQTTINSREQLTLDSSVIIDSFDSSLGDYASQAINSTNGYSHASMNGHARSNAGIILNANTNVFGDAIPGPTYSVSFAMGSFVSGSTTPAPTPFTFPPITLPTFPVTGAFSVPNGASASLPAGNHSFTSMTINKDATLTIQGPADILVDDFLGGKDANLVIDATLGPVTFHVANTYTHTNGFESTSAPGSPMAVAFLVEGAQNIVFPSNTNIRGAYYTPNANILFSGGNECWGAFAGNRIDMANNMRFHFDEDLMNHWDADTGQGKDAFDLIAWGKTDVEPDALLADRRDPLTILGTRKSQLAKPVDLWVKVP